MLRVLLPPAQPGRRQFQYSLPALFCNAAGDDGPGAAVSSTLTVGGHQDNTVWVKPQRVAPWHARLRLKLSPEAAAGGSCSSPTSPSGSPASPSPQAVKLQVRCLAPASVSGSSCNPASWDSARASMWRELPPKTWCTLHEGDVVVLGAGAQALADAQQGGDSLAGCCLLQVAGLRELRKWAVQQARLRRQAAVQPMSPGLVARHGAFAQLYVDALVQQQQQQPARQQQKPQQGRPQPDEQPRQQPNQQQAAQGAQQPRPQSHSQQRQSEGSDQNLPAAKKQRRDEGARLQEPPPQLPRPAPSQPAQQRRQRQQQPQQLTGRSNGHPAATSDRLAAPQRRLNVVQELLDSVQKLAGPDGEEAQRAVQLVQQAAQQLSHDAQQRQRQLQGGTASPSAPASPTSSSSDAETVQLPVARHLPFATPALLQPQHHSISQHAAASGEAATAAQPPQQHTRLQPERSAGSSPSGPVPERHLAAAASAQHVAAQQVPSGATAGRQGSQCAAATAAAAAPHRQQATTRAAASARNAGATASSGAAPSASEPAARQQQQPPQQQPCEHPGQREAVQDVKAELKRLGKRYTGSDPTQGIRLRVKQDTLDRLRRIAQQAPDLPCFATVKPQWGLRRLLAEGFRPAQLCKRTGAAALVGEALTLRTTWRLKKDDACGWLSGVLTEAGGRKASSFTSSEYFIPRERLDELAREFGAEYGGEDLMLEMSWETNEFGFLQDTLFRQVDEAASAVNVKPFVALLHSTAEGLAIPLPVVYATRPIKVGEELVADGMDELDEQDLLLDALACRLIASGWRCHLLDAFWLRLARLAQQQCRQLAASSSTTGAAHRLRLALRGAVRLYYGDSGGSSSSSSDAGCTGEDDSSSSACGGVPAELLQQLEAALATSTRAHRPPCSATSLSYREAPPLDQQFRPLARRELPPLCRASDFSGLPAEVLGALDGAPDSQPLEEDVRQRLRQGDVPGAAVCEVRYRLHRVRLLTPPSCPAHSLNVAPSAARPATGDCVGVYIGRVVTADVAEEESHDSAYLYDIKARQVGPHLGRGQAWAYDGPDLVVDASQLRNELAFANDVFAAAPSTRPSLYTQVIWDPEFKRPALKMNFVLSWRAKPLQELLLSYGDSYWPVEGPKLRRKHEAYAARAAQAIAAVHAALEAVGVPPADLAACLAPVDLAAGEHRFYEAFSLD